MSRILFAIVACGFAVDAAAQNPRARTVREPKQTVVATVNVSGAAADDSADTFGDGRITVGQHGDADAQLVYQRHAGKLTVGVSGRSVARYAPGAAGMAATRHQGTVDLSATGTHTQFHVVQSGSYSPFYQFGAQVNSEATPLEESLQSHNDFANARQTAFGLATAAQLKQEIGRRSSLAMSYDFHQTTFDRRDLDFTSQSAAISLSRRLTRFVSLHTGYAYRTAHTAATMAGSVLDHALDLGLDYSRNLSPSRKTSFSFSSGSSLTPRGGGMAMNVTGNAMLARQIGRTWSARVTGARSVQLLEGFAAPVLTDAVTASFGGALSRRTGMSTSIGYAHGQSITADQSSTTFGNWTAGAGFHATVSRSTSIDAQYFYYGHRFDPRLLAGATVPRELTRHGVRVGLTWRATLLRSRG